MNKKYLYFLALTPLFFPATPVLAQDLTPTPAATLTPVPTTVKHRNGFEAREIKNEIKEIKKDFKYDPGRHDRYVTGTITPRPQRPTITPNPTRVQLRRDQATRIFNNLVSSFNHRLGVLSNSHTRIQDRLTQKTAKLPGNASLIQAQTKLDGIAALKTQYQADLAVLTTAFNNLLSSASPLNVIPELKTQANAVKNDLKNIQSTLVDALRLMVKAR
jgi:hypothetical protein